MWYRSTDAAQRAAGAHCIATQCRPFPDHSPVTGSYAEPHHSLDDREQSAVRCSTIRYPERARGADPNSISLVCCLQPCMLQLSPARHRGWPVVRGEKVAAVVIESDQMSRRAGEDALALELSARGAIGSPMHTLLDDADPNEAKARAPAIAAIENERASEVFRLMSMYSCGTDAGASGRSVIPAGSGAGETSATHPPCQSARQSLVDA